MQEFKQVVIYTVLIMRDSIVSTVRSIRLHYFINCKSDDLLRNWKEKQRKEKKKMKILWALKSDSY